MPVLQPPPYQDKAGTQRWSEWYRLINRVLQNVSISVGGIDDVTITAPVGDNSLLQYDSGTGQWENQTDIVLPGTTDAEGLVTIGDAIVTVNATGGDQGPGSLNAESYFIDGVDITAGGIDHGTLAGLDPDDDHTQYLFLAGRAGGQSVFGGTGVSDALRLQGSTDAALGDLELVAPVTLDWDFTVSGSTGGFVWDNVIPSSGGAVVGMLRNATDITVDNATFISATVYDTSIVEHVVNPGFAVATLFLAQPVYRTTTAAVNPTQSFILAAQPQFRNDGAGAGRSVTNFYATSVAASVGCTTSGDVLTVTNYTGMNVSPIWSTVSGSTISFGTVRGVHMRNPAKGLFAPGAGVETMTAYYGLDVDNITFAAGTEKAAVRSALAGGATNYFLLNTSTAVSDFGASNIHFNDISGILFGNTPTTADLNIGVLGGGTFFFNWVTGDTGQLRISSEAPGNTTDRFLWTSTVSNEYTFDCDRFSLGAQTGSNGNQVGIFVAGTRSTSLGGDWSDFLLTQAGNITVNAAMGTVAAWTINAPSITLGTGSVTSGVGLLVGGNPNQGTNRYGLSVISSPSGGTLNYCARFSGAAGVRIDGVFEHTGTTFGLYGTTPTAQSAAYTPTNVTPDRAYDADATTLDELSDVVGTLIADLQLTGVIG